MTSADRIAGIPALAGPKHEALAQWWAQGDVSLERFAGWLREQPATFDACDLQLPPGELLQRSFEMAFCVGSYSISLGVATVMHLYMLGALATYPTRDKESLAKREAIFGQILQNKWLVANSGSDLQVRSANGKAASMTAELLAEGLSVSGHKTFVSLSTVADLLVFTASEKASGALLSLFTPLRGVDAIRFDDSPFPPFLRETGTRSVVFDRLLLPMDNVISGGGVTFENAHAFQRMWFCALIPAVYLGAATAALHEARSFARANQADGRPLADLDGVTVEFGRTTLALASALLGFESVRKAVDAACRAPDGDGTDEAANLASVFKYAGMRTVGEVATGLRSFVGTRAMMPGSKLLQFSQESMFGPLHPELEPLLERRLGRKCLQAT
jgi:alkylation response protein AidB-like acyl-CoA dehydrogenase